MTLLDDLSNWSYNLDTSFSSDTLLISTMVATIWPFSCMKVAINSGMVSCMPIVYPFAFNEIFIVLFVWVSIEPLLQVEHSYLLSVIH